MTPLSSLIVSGGKTPISLEVLDRVGNPTIADISDIEVETIGGYIIDDAGNKKTKATYSIFEGSIFLNIGSDTPGTIRIKAHIVDSLISESEDVGVIS